MAPLTPAAQLRTETNGASPPALQPFGQFGLPIAVSLFPDTPSGLPAGPGPQPPAAAGQTHATTLAQLRQCTGLSIDHPDMAGRLQQMYAGAGLPSKAVTDVLLPIIVQTENDQVRLGAMRVLERQKRLPESALIALTNILTGSTSGLHGARPVSKGNFFEIAGSIVIIMTNHETLPDAAWRDLINIFISRPAHLAPMAQGKTHLPDFVLAAFAEKLDAMYSHILGEQSGLPTDVQAVLEAKLKEAGDSHGDSRTRAAHLLLAADPAHAEAARFIDRETSPRRSGPPLPRHVDRARWLANELASLKDASFVDDVWDIFPQVTLQDIEAVLMRAYSLEHHPEIEHFIERTRRYTRSPRRLLKFLSAIIHPVVEAGSPLDEAFWNRQLIAPEEELKQDMSYKKQVLAALREVLPSVVAACDRSLKIHHESNNIAGILVVGGMADHPTSGSDIDVLFVTKDVRKPTARNNYIFKTELKKHCAAKGLTMTISWIHEIPLNSLRFKRLLASLGAIYIPGTAEDASQASPLLKIEPGAAFPRTAAAPTHP